MTDSRDHVVRLKAALTPEQVAVALGLKRKERGRRFFCPVCQSDGTGKSPDLAVGDKGFTCHKCGVKGDALKLVEVAAGLDFPSAVAWMEKQTGIEPPDRRRRGRPVAPVILRPEKPSGDPSGVGGVEGRVMADPTILAAFLSACRPVEGPALDWLTKTRQVAPKVVADMGIRFCGREYSSVMDRLKADFGEEALLRAGLLKRSRAGRAVPSFWHYYAAKAGFLVIPFMLKGRPVALKVRPPIEKAEAVRRKMVRFMNTAATIPVMYNADALSAGAGRVIICEGESDTWTALTAGFPAVGIPGAKSFKPEWIESFRPFVAADGRSLVYLALDSDKAGTEGATVIADLFRKAGLPVPLKLPIPEGMDLTEFMKEGRTS